MSHATVKPARVKRHSDEMRCDVLSGYGHRGTCPCGWQGPVRGAHSIAREDARIHTATCNDKSPGAAETARGATQEDTTPMFDQSNEAR